MLDAALDTTWAPSLTPPMLDSVKDALYRVITSPKGDGLAPIRLPKDLARRLNATLGSPLAPMKELARRKDAKGRLAALRDARNGSANGNGAAHAPDAASSTAKDAAPVMVYFEKDRGTRELSRIEEALGSKGIAYKLLDVTGDESTIDFVLRESGCERDELPVVFVGGEAIGNFPALVKADVSGELQRAVYGA
jgi:hypothetical protein